VGRNDGDDERTRAVQDLMASLATGSSAIPTSTFGRLRRTAGALLRGRSALLTRDGVDAAAVEQLVRSFGELKGVAMKMGQILSYIDDALPAETSALLGVLRTWSQPTPFEQVEQIIREELGERSAALLAGLARTPVSSASIGQVHRGRLPGGEEVAVKVRHPGIDDAIRADFRAARAGIALARLLAPGADVRQAIEEARTGFLEECNYRLEAGRQQRFVELLAGDERLVIPAVHHEWSSDRVLTTGWCDGASLDQLLATEPTAETRARLGRALYEFYVGTLYRHGVFNADPHPGNLLFQQDGRLVILDHGCVREFDRDAVAAIAELSRAVRRDEPGAIRGALVRLGAKDPGAGKAYTVTRGLLRGFYAPTLEPGVRRVSSSISRSAREVMTVKRSILRLHLPGKLLFLFRIRFGLYAVLARLGAELDLRSLEETLASSAPSL
jgi:predicted unusual protein kinase regulating ubiquinone biosynthesis (AarF/ABC1/UbiB family)